MNVSLCHVSAVKGVGRLGPGEWLLRAHCPGEFLEYLSFSAEQGEDLTSLC